jgi:hypothetical protein
MWDAIKGLIGAIVILALAIFCLNLLNGIPK